MSDTSLVAADACSVLRFEDAGAVEAVGGGCDGRVGGGDGGGWEGE